MKRILVALCTLALAGCGIVAKIDPRTEYQKTVADYRACLDAHPWELKLVTANGWLWKLRSAPTTICLPGSQPM